MQFMPDTKSFERILGKVNIQEYETSRNFLNGAVTYLSPYITHGYESMPNLVFQFKKQGLTPQHKLYAEFGWREYYYHVWSHLGNGIFQDIRPALPEVNYQSFLPKDILQAKTGLAPIDLAITTLYETGYLHNHARMWLASYLIHFRKIHWRTCADWMYGYLLDGDLASNHLSWQWVGSTFSSKPYLFNAENITKYAPVEWHCTNSILDQSYEALDAIARSNEILDNSFVLKQLARNNTWNETQTHIPPLLSLPPEALLKKYQVVADLKLFDMSKSNNFKLVHPWDLKGTRDQKVQLGILHTPFFQEFPWSEQRWEFVLNRLSQLCDVIVLGDLQKILIPYLKAHKSIRIDVQHTYNPHYADLLLEISKTNDTLMQPMDRFLANPDQFCPSFTKFWQLVVKKEKFPKH